MPSGEKRWPEERLKFWARKFVEAQDSGEYVSVDEFAKAVGVDHGALASWVGNDLSPPARPKRRKRVRSQRDKRWGRDGATHKHNVVVLSRFAIHGLRGVWKEAQTEVLEFEPLPCRTLEDMTPEEIAEIERAHGCEVRMGASNG